MLPLDTHGKITGVCGTAICKVLTLAEAERCDFDPAACLIWAESKEEFDPGDRRWAGWVSSADAGADGIVVAGLKDDGVVAPGDIIRLVENSSRIRVLYRRGSKSNTLLATERCNSLCLMCSQPPRDVADSWLVNDILATIPLVDRDEGQLGISGGEPTLLGDDLAVVIHQAKTCLPATGLHILTNGRGFRDESVTRVMAAVRHPKLRWGIPLYSSYPETHDYIVQTEGAWHETVSGLYNLARHNAEIELRVVVQRSNVDHLSELAYFIFRNLTFVRHVAFMGLEPIGLARRNRASVWIDPSECADELGKAVHFMANRGIPVSIYNFPLCALPSDLWPFSAQSISDWKNTYLTECERCEVRQRCGGFFRWIDKAWLPSSFGPLEKLDRIES